MDIIQLQYFVAVAEALNFREAARRLGVAQSSVSRQISDLETQLGATLFSRSNRNVALTEEGSAFLPYALNILHTSENAAFTLERMRQGAVGHLAISAVSTACENLTDILSTFFLRYPEIAVDVTFNTGREQIIAMSEPRYDFHFAHESMLPADGRLDFLVTHKDELVVVLPKGHPCAGRPLQFSALRDERFIICMQSDSPQLYQQVMDVCRYHNYQPRLINRYDKAESVLLAVSAGLGISILPRALTRVFFADRISTLPIPDPDTSRTYIAAWPHQLLNPAAKLFLQVVKEHFHSP